MALNGIDIASYQQGINLSVVPADFVIVKATEGTGYTNPDWKRQAQQTLATGKLLGLYHYSNGGDVVAEATHFLNTIKNYVGKAILFLDWENQTNPSFGKNDYNWMNHWLTHVKQHTKTTPMPYFSAQVLNFPKVTELKYDFWVAQYASMDTTGYQTNPWNEGAYKCKIRQYSPAGRLAGWSGNLDLDKFYGDRKDWEAYFKNVSVSNDGSPTTAAKPSAAPTGTTLELLVRTMKREFGDGEDRKKNLGSRYTEVQSVIDHISVAQTSTLVVETLADKYGTGETRRTVLGSRYDEVQNEIEKGNYQPIYYQIQAGDTLSAIAERFGTTWQKIASINQISNPNYIMAGQIIRVK